MSLKDSNESDPPALQAIEDFVKEALRVVAKEHAELMETAQFLKRYRNNPQTRPCPFCGGQMLYIAPLQELEFGRNCDGVPLSAYAPNFGMDWECQQCKAATAAHIKPSKSSLKDTTYEEWTRDQTPLRGNGVPIQLLRKYPRLKTVVRHTWRSHRNWYLKTDDGAWYWFPGLGRELLERLPD